jgi:two-component system, sensor histidine kinase PdtaS
MFRFFIICSFLLVISPANAQTEAEKPLRALLTMLQKSKTDTNRLTILFQLSEFYLKNPLQNKPGTDSSFHYLQQAIRLADSIQSKKWRHESLRYLGKYYFIKGEKEQGKQCFMRVINELNQAGDKKGEINWLTALEREILYTDSTGITKIDCFKRIAKLYDQLNNREEKIIAELHLVTIYMYLGNFAKSENEIIAILENNKPVPERCFQFGYFHLALINRYKGNLDKALYYILECAKSTEKGGDRRVKSNCYGELALIYQELGQTDKSIEWYGKTLDIRKKDGYETYVIYRTAGFLIQELLKQGGQKKALEVLTRLPIDNPPQTAYEWALLFQVRANYYSVLKQYALAEKNYQEMINSKGFSEEKSEVTTIAYQDMGEFYLGRKEYNKAGEYLTKSLDADNGGTTLSRIRDIHLMLYKVDSSTGNYLSAINHLRTHQQLKDSIFNEAKSKQIQELEIRYETGKKEQSIQLLEKEGILQQSKLVQANNTRNWILGAVILLLTIVALLLYQARLKQQTNKKLQLQQKEIGQQNLSLQHLVNEKEWLVKEIHHRVKNNLHTISGLLDTQVSFVKTDEAVLALNDSQRRVQAMSLIHQKLYQTENLSVVEMSGYIHELVDHLSHSLSVSNRILFKLEIENMVLNLSYALPLGLILNEAITNSIKYAFPGNKDGVISILLKKQEGLHCLLTIADNGTGLPPGFNHQRSSSMGMKLMKGLSDDIHAGFSITNNNGTEINISFKYDASVSNQPIPAGPDQSIEIN